MRAISPTTRLYRCPERQIGTHLPIPLSTRLDALTEIGKEAWAPTTRKEVLCAMMLAFLPTTRALRKTLNAYRSATVADSFVKDWAEWRFLYPPKSSGPRTQYTLFDTPPKKPDPPPHCTPSEPLPTAAAYRIGMIIPIPLAGRIDRLVELANAAGMRTSRQELVAAAILAAPTDGQRLARQLQAYWQATAADAAIAGQQNEALRARPGRAHTPRSAKPARERPSRP